MSMVEYEENLPRLEQRTPEDWRAFLQHELLEQAAIAEVYEAFYDGRHPLQFATSKYREAFGNLFSAFADNWCQIVVDSAVERLRVIGFRVNDKENEDAWALWQRNQLDVESVVAHTEAGKSGRAFLLVDPNDGEPVITVEHAQQMVVATDPANRRKRLAALKQWLGDDGHLYVTLILPDTVFKWESQETVGPGGHMLTEPTWVARQGEEPEASNPLGMVPVIPLENKPSIMGFPHSDLEPAIPLQNAINKLCTDLIVTSEYGAFPQRVLTGVEVPRDPETGQPLAAGELKAAMSRLWTFARPDVTVTSLPQADLTNFTTAIELFTQHLAAQTRTPPHYLLARLVNTSGDALSVAEAGLVSKCRTKTLFFSDGWEEAIALALTATGTEVDQAECEAIWQNPERIAQGQLVDAALKKKTLGIPLPVIWLDLGYTPEQIAEMEAYNESEAAKALEEAAVPEEAVVRETIAAPAGAGGPQPAPAPTPPAPPPAPPPA